MEGDGWRKMGLVVLRIGQPLREHVIGDNEKLPHVLGTSRESPLPLL